MHFSPTQRLAPVCTAVCALVAGMVLSWSAHASSGHGDEHGHGEPRAAASKAPAKVVDEKPAGKEASKGGEKEKGGREPAAAKGEETKASVSMSELRDMIDQKIAEVRSQREAAPAPVVRVRAKGKPAAAAPKKPAGQLVASAAVSAHDAKGVGALLPLPVAVDDGHDHAPEAATPAGVRVPNLTGRDVHWAYSGDTGPENWGRLKPEFQQCMLGKRQSTIDIRDGIAVQLDPIQFDYRPTGFRVIDNGHTVQVNVDPGNGIIVQGRRYELVQFHFHRPSEERINGKQYEMVAHLVHKDLDGKLAVVAVLMDAGKGHPIVQQVWNNLPLEKQVEQAAMAPMDLNQLLPEKRQYYTYMGSLTTPPCTEGVLWMVMKQPAAVSPEQIGVFSKLYQMNARPIQSASGRLIKEGQ